MYLLLLLPHTNFRILSLTLTYLQPHRWMNGLNGHFFLLSQWGCFDIVPKTKSAQPLFCTVRNKRKLFNPMRDVSLTFPNFEIRDWSSVLGTRLKWYNTWSWIIRLSYWRIKNVREFKETAILIAGELEIWVILCKIRPIIKKTDFHTLNLGYGCTSA